jgi:type I restriction enzyme, S subunit
MWKTVKINDVCLVTDYVANGSFKSLSDNVKYLTNDGHAILVRLTDFTKGWNGNYKYVDEHAYNFLAKTKLFAGDLLISNVGEPGKTFLVPELEMLMTLGPNSILVRPNNGVLNTKFFKYFIDSLYGKALLDKIISGTTQKKFNKTGFRNLEIPIPSLAEQERIVAKLDAAFAEIDEAVNAAIAKETEVQKLKASFLSSSLSGDAVMWKTQKLSDVIEKGETVNPTTNPDTKFSYIDVSSVDRKNFSISKIQTLRGKDAPSRARRLVKTGDVLFATVRPTLQRIAIVPEKLNGEVCSTGYIVLRPKASIICNKFIFYYMLSEKVNTQMEAMQTGASYPAVNNTQVKNLHVSFPSLSEQKLIVARLDRAFSELKNANEVIVKSKANYLALKSAILTKELQSNEAA